MVYLLHWALPSHRWRKAFLLAASYLFYAGWDWRFLALILGSSVLDYVVGLGIDQTDGRDHRRLLRGWSWGLYAAAAGSFAFLKTGVPWLTRFFEQGYGPDLFPPVVGIPVHPSPDALIPPFPAGLADSMMVWGVPLTLAAFGFLARVVADVRLGRKVMLALSLVFNLGALAVFKYFNFFVDSAITLLTSMGVSASYEALRIVLPVGISFYTFQTLSYSIDVYRRQLEPTRSALDFFFFVAFFPQLVAGPIVRASEFLPQLVAEKHLNARDFFEGLERFFIGLFKKLFIADLIGGLVDGVFADVGHFSSLEVLFGSIGFCFQIYADFSGYSDMAIGIALMLGYRLPVNFRLPYLALSITDYWRRWHISLSTWFRDYLYIPIGGNRGGVWKTYRNLITTFLLTGLWHGANWTFVMFGVWNGAILILERWWRFLKDRAGLRMPAGATLIVLPICFLLASTSTVISFTWFRAESLSHALEVFERVLGGHSGYDGKFIYRNFYAVAALVVIYHVLAACRVRERLTELDVGWRIFLRAFSYTFFICMVLDFAPMEERPFIYFQF